jgi:hypothetical protein
MKLFSRSILYVLDDKHDLIVQESKRNLEAIVMLEETVKLLEKRALSAKDSKSVTVQAEIISCEECEFPADCVTDLVDHLHEFHPLPYYEVGIECHY